MLEERQNERRRLAGSGLRACEEIAFGEDVRNGLGLNGRREGVAFVGHRPQKGRGEAERREPRLARGDNVHFF